MCQINTYSRSANSTYTCNFKFFNLSGTLVLICNSSMHVARWRSFLFLMICLKIICILHFYMSSFFRNNFDLRINAIHYRNYSRRHPFTKLTLDPDGAFWRVGERLSIECTRATRNVLVVERFPDGWHGHSRSSLVPGKTVGVLTGTIRRPINRTDRDVRRRTNTSVPLKQFANTMIGIWFLVSLRWCA
jgi:hypothetical protein